MQAYQSPAERDVGERPELVSNASSSLTAYSHSQQLHPTHSSPKMKRMSLCVPVANHEHTAQLHSHTIREVENVVSAASECRSSRRLQRRVDHTPLMLDGIVEILVRID